MVLKISPVKIARRATNYILSTKAHDGSGVRNEILTGINLESGISFASQFERLAALNPAATNEGMSYILSASEKELPSDDPDSPYKMAEIAKRFCHQVSDDRLWVIAVQKDGEGGKVHAHCICCNVSLSDHTALSKEQYFWLRQKDTADAVTKEVLGFVDSGKTKNRVSRVEARKIKNGEYSWLDDLKGRIRKAYEDATSVDEFKENLAKAHVTITRDGKGKGGRYYSYEMNKNSVAKKNRKGLPTKLKARSRTLGTDFAPDYIESVIFGNQAAKVYDEPAVPRHRAAEAATDAGETEAIVNANDNPEPVMPDMDFNKSVVAKRKREEDEEEKAEKFDASEYAAKLYDAFEEYRKSAEDDFEFH